jgi:hypothetical protein
VLNFAANGTVTGQSSQVVLAYSVFENLGRNITIKARDSAYKSSLLILYAGLQADTC